MANIKVRATSVFCPPANRAYCMANDVIAKKPTWKLLHVLHLRLWAGEGRFDTDACKLLHQVSATSGIFRLVHALRVTLQGHTCGGYWYTAKKLPFSWQEQHDLEVPTYGKFLWNILTLVWRSTEWPRTFVGQNGKWDPWSTANKDNKLENYKLLKR